MGVVPEVFVAMSSVLLLLPRNMDIIGVEEVSAEAELLSAVVAFLESVGLTAKDIKIKVSSRKVLQAVLEDNNVPADLFGAVCVVVDKLDKMPAEKVCLSGTYGQKCFKTDEQCYTSYFQ